MSLAGSHAAHNLGTVGSLAGGAPADGSNGLFSSCASNS